MDFKHNMDKINNGVVTAMDENGTTDIKSPIKRLGSTRKLLLFNNIRLQLNEQLRCLDIRMESQVSLIQELQDFFRRRGEVELDYSKSLDKLAKSLQLRHKEQKQKREQWPMFSSYACWQQMVNQTKSLSRDHAALAEIYSTHLITRLQTVIEDVQRIYRKCREIGYETHEEILRVLQELHKTMKTYHSYQTECKAMETKLKAAEAQKAKVQMSIAKEKLEKSKKYRLIEKEVLKRKDKYKDAKLKALRAKNEYQLCLEASNTTIHKYFVDDLSDLIDCMDLGFHSMVSRALLMHVTADQGRCRSVLQGSDALSHIVHSMDSRADKQKFLEQHHGAFMIPKKIEFQGQHMDDDVIESDIQKSLYTDMETRLQHLGQRVGNLRAESEEIWKTLETAETNLLEILNEKDYDCSPFFGDASLHAAVKLESMAKTNKSDRQEIEEFYISKIREFILGTSRIARLDSKADLLRQALAKDSLRITNTTTVTKSIITKRKRIGRMNISGQPKLFGGSLEEYLEATNEEIPLIMRSCIRVINLFGLHHQGIFRVSGSQVEISNFREGFERGDDPLADTTDASDINSVAGVLKLYLRELREPLFPIIYFEHFIQLAQLKSKHDLVKGLQHFLTSLPKSVIIVIRYLFAFLNHLSEYSDENMMDAYNLAICFGPTLMPAPEDKDQVQYQNQVNELIKNMIELHEDLFPKDLGGIQYEKYISQDQFIDIDVGDSPVDQITEDPDSEVYPSEDESDILEATAQFDFNARSNRELSLCKGDTVILKKQVSNDWWHGTVRGKDGLIPDKYISLKIKDEDRDKISEQMKSSSSEESVRRRRPSGTIITRPQLKMHNPSIDTSINQSVLKTSSGSDIKMVTGQTQKPKPVQEYQNLPVTTNGMCSNTKQSVKDTESHSSLVETKSNNSESNVDNHNKELHYESVDAIKAKYEYHDEPNCFESSMDYLEDYSNQFQFETKKPTEPIYAEPNKTQQTTIKKSDPSDDSDKVVLRNSSRRQQTEQSTSNISNKDNSNVKHDSLPINLIDKTSRFSESDLGKKESITEGKDGSNQPSRKYHTKSFSLSENRVASQLFLQSRDLWEKRTEMASHQNLNQQRILSRSRIAPDLVMDLPLSIGGTTDMTSTSSDQIPFMSESLDNMTAAERFAAQSQNTLKKNDRVVSDQLDDKHEMQTDLKDCDKSQGIISDEIKEKVNKMEDVLRIEENGDRKSTGKDLIKSSPIPSRNTQKFVNQFADLHLTGGCKTTETGSPLVSSLSGSGGQQPMSSFKPQVRTKPQILRKPLVLPPTTPEMSRRHKE